MVKRDNRKKWMIYLPALIIGCGPSPTPDEIRTRLEMSHNLVHPDECGGKVIASIITDSIGWGYKTTINFTDGKRLTIVSTKYRPKINKEP